MYEVLAPGYDVLYGEEQQAKLEKVAFVLEGRILDIGAGTGLVARYFPKVISLDPCWEMLKQAPGIKVLGCAEHLPFTSGSFDSIISLTALHHTEIDQVIRELKRMRAPHMAFSVLKRSKKCKEIVQKLTKAFPFEAFEEEKDILLIIK